MLDTIYILDFSSDSIKVAKSKSIANDFSHDKL